MSHPTSDSEGNESLEPRYTLRELVSIALRQQEMVLHDVDTLDWKAYIVLAGQLGVFGAGLALTWPPWRAWLLVLGLVIGLANLLVTGTAIRTNQYVLAPNVKEVWEEHGLETSDAVARQLVSDIEDAIEKNVEACRSKGHRINRGFELLFFSILAIGLEWFLEWGMKH